MVLAQIVARIESLPLNRVSSQHVAHMSQGNERASKSGGNEIKRDKSESFKSM